MVTIPETEAHPAPSNLSYLSDSSDPSPVSISSTLSISSTSTSSGLNKPGNPQLASNRILCPFQRACPERDPLIR